MTYQLTLTNKSLSYTWHQIIRGVLNGAQNRGRRFVFGRDRDGTTINDFLLPSVLMQTSIIVLSEVDNDVPLVQLLLGLLHFHQKFTPMFPSSCQKEIQPINNGYGKQSTGRGRALLHFHQQTTPLFLSSEKESSKRNEVRFLEINKVLRL